MSISEMISHDVTLPAQVLMRSAVYSRRWTLMPELSPSAASVRTKQRHHADGGPTWCRDLQAGSGLLGLVGRLVRASAFLGREVVVVRHAPVDVGVEVPANGALGKLPLRLDDLHEQRVVLPLRHDVVEDLELLAQDGIRRLVELDLVLGLQLDVVA